MTNTANWKQVKEIFSTALEMEPDRRESYISEQCADNAELKAEVESWLASHTESEDFIETPLLSREDLFSTNGSSVGRRFGNYQIIKEIGHGGMGTVYLAKRSDGEFEQEVALKIVRQSIAESQMIERFRRERQILASLNHPNIAKLLDGGVSETGEPFIAMEYVEGETATDFARQRSLPLNDILRLFLKVCSAVEYAHRNLIVHRDIKPGNILIAPDGEPKLLDFGLARLLSDHQAGGVTETKTAFRALTPAYASPEQLRGDPITTASDIYSLGIVLYELVSGDRPFQFEEKSLEEIIRTVSDFEPPPPSNAPLANRQLKGDLDNIILTALRKEPERRYRSVEQFANDIERYLSGLPVSARPNTFVYRTSKFLRRHRVGAVMASVVALVLMVGLAGTLWQARHAWKEKKKAESVSAFLEQTLKYSNPLLSPLKKAGQVTTVNEVIDEAAKRLDNGEFDAEPEVKLELERMIATTYFSQGNYMSARKHMAEYVTLLKNLYGEGDPRYILGSLHWAALLFAKGEMVEAEDQYRANLPSLKLEYSKGNVTADNLADVFSNFGYLRRTQGDSREAESLFRESLDLIPKMSADGKKMFSTTRSTLASTIADQGRFDEALAAAREAVEEYRQRGEFDSPNRAFALNVLGGFLTEKGNLAEAEAALHQSEYIISLSYAPTSLWVGDNLRNQALLLYEQGKYEDAIAKADSALKIYEEGFGKHYDHYPTTLIAKGSSLTKLGRTTEGESVLREAFGLRLASLDKDHFWVAAAQGALGECLAAQGRFDEAEPLLKTSFESLTRSQEPNSPRLEIAHRRLISLYESWGKPQIVDQYKN